MSTSPIQPTYFTGHPDGIYRVADPQPAAAPGYVMVPREMLERSKDALGKATGSRAQEVWADIRDVLAAAPADKGTPGEPA